MSTWLEKSPLFGHYVRHYRQKTGIPLTIKISTLAILWAGLIVSMFLADMLWLYIILPTIGVGVSFHITLIRTTKKPDFDE